MSHLPLDRAHLNTESRTAVAAEAAPAGAGPRSRPAAGTAGTSDLKKTRQGKEVGFIWQREIFLKHI